MPTSENKEKPRSTDLAWAADFELRHCTNPDVRGPLIVLKAMAERLESCDHLVGLHADDIKLFMELVQALTMRIVRIEAQLGITEPVVVPGD